MFNSPVQTTLDVPSRTLAIDDKKLKSEIEKNRIALPDKIEDFKREHVEIKFDKQGNEINATNPFLVSTYFFKSISPKSNLELNYTGDQIAFIYDYYMEAIEQINMEIMPFQPTLSHFLKFIGLNLSTFNNLKQSPDDSIRQIVERINTDMFDANITLAQHSKLSSSTTIYRAKVENEMIEKKKPNINVNVTTKPIDLDRMNERLIEIQNLNKKQIKYEEK